jgi:WD40 repeat protein
MKRDASEDAEPRLAARAEKVDSRIAAGDLPPPTEPDSLSSSKFSTPLAARESLLSLERTWPRGGSHPESAAGMGAEPAPGSELRPPTEFGRFRIVRELGRGGFGVVLLAIDPDLSRPVALKLPRAEWLLEDQGRKRFVREAKAVAGLDHPNIAPLYEAGEVHGVCYMASAYCDGPDLARWLREQGGRLDPRMAARIVAELADAIQHAHERGILHRDLKPSNVLLQRRPVETGEMRTDRPSADEGRWGFSPRIVDFGLARLIDRPAEESTESFGALGSAPYMAPEQAEGKKVGPAADIYGLGAVLYALLCGRPPHRGRSDVDTLRRVVADEVVRPRRRRRDVPRDLEAICLRCLEKDPARRYANAGAVRDDLRRFLAGQPTRARTAGTWELARRAARRHRFAIAALAVVAIAAAAILAGISRYEARIRETRDAASLRSEEAKRSGEAARRARYVSDLRQAQPLIDGHHARRAIELLERHRPGPGETDLREFAWRYLRGQCDTSRRTLTGFAGSVYFAEFSPGGDLLAAASRDGSVRIWRTGSWEMIRSIRADKTEVNVATFSPDGTMLATVGDEGTVKLWDVATGLHRFERPAHRGDAVVARFTPDGRSLLTGGRTDSFLKLWDVESGAEIRSIRAHSREFECAVVSPDGRLLATTGGGEIKLWDVARLSLLASAASSGSIQGAAFSHDGTMLAVADEGAKTVLLLEVPSLSPKRALRGHTEGVFAVAFSRDNRSVFSAGDDRTIRCWDVATGSLNWVHHGHTGRIWGLAMSPDGRTIASAGGDGTVKLWDPAPPRDHSTITIEQPLAALRFSRDGKLLATLGRDGSFSVRESDTGHLVCARPLDPRDCPRPAWRRPIAAGAISEDMRTVLIADAEGAVAIWDAEGGRLRAAPGDRDGPVDSLGITPDGTRGYLLRGGRQAEFWELTEARRQRLVRGPFGAAISPLDGHRLLIHDTSHNSPIVWDPTCDRVMRPSAAIHYMPRCLGLSRDGHRLAFYEGFVDWMGSPEYRVRIIETDRLVEPPSPIVSPSPVTALAFDPTDRTLAGGGEDHRVRLWDRSGGEELLSLGGHSGPVSLVQFLADGDTLATGAVRPDGATEIFLWRTARP